MLISESPGPDAWVLDPCVLDMIPRHGPASKMSVRFMESHYQDSLQNNCSHDLLGNVLSPNCLRIIVRLNWIFHGSFHFLIQGNQSHFSQVHLCAAPQASTQHNTDLSPSTTWITNANMCTPFLIRRWEKTIVQVHLREMVSVLLHVLLPSILEYQSRLLPPPGSKEMKPSLPKPHQHKIRESLLIPKIHRRFKVI